MTWQHGAEETAEPMLTLIDFRDSPVFLPPSPSRHAFRDFAAEQLADTAEALKRDTERVLGIKRSYVTKVIDGLAPPAPVQWSEGRDAFEVTMDFPMQVTAMSRRTGKSRMLADIASRDISKALKNVYGPFRASHMNRLAASLEHPQQIRDRLRGRGYSYGAEPDLTDVERLEQGRIPPGWSRDLARDLYITASGQEIDALAVQAGIRQPQPFAWQDLPPTLA